MRRKFSAAAFASALAGSVFADNAVFNDSFELGTDGFALVRFLRLDTNPKLKFRALETAPGAAGIVVGAEEAVRDRVRLALPPIALHPVSAAKGAN